MMVLKRNVDLTATMDVIECESGEFVGDVKEFPVMVLGSSEDDLEKKAWDALLVYFLRHPEETHRFTQG